MPDQSSAATEHAILQEITAPLKHLPDDAVAAVHADFPVALRGYDRMAVDAYVQRTRQLVAELQATRSPEAAVRRALERVGEQISGILQRAHETAEQITAQSRREAEDRLEQARIEASEIAARAAQRVRDLDADTDRIWIERHRIVDDARDLASQLLALAEAAADRFPGEVEELEDTGPTSEPPFGAAAPGEAAYTPEEEPDPTGDLPAENETEIDPEQAEHLAAHEEDDDLLDEDPTTGSVDYGAGEPDTAEAASPGQAPDPGRDPDPEQDPYAREDDDIEATRRFSPADLQAPADERAKNPSPGSPRSVIPPASPAANRRANE